VGRGDCLAKAKRKESEGEDTPSAGAGFENMRNFTIIPS